MAAAKKKSGKGQNCCICAHPKRKEIDRALVAPKPNFSAIARIFNTNRDSVRRHLEGGHVAEKIAKAAEAQEALDADDLLNEIHETEKITKDIIKAAMGQKKQVRVEGEIIEVESPDHETALKALARREKQIELKGKVLGAFKDPAQGKGGNTPGGIGSTVVVYVPDNGRKTGK